MRTGGVSARDEIREDVSQGVPDVLSYLQAATDLTRSTLVRILIESGRLDQFFSNPQQFMDGYSRNHLGAFAGTDRPRERRGSV